MPLDHKYDSDTDKRFQYKLLFVENELTFVYLRAMQTNKCL